MQTKTSVLPARYTVRACFNADNQKCGCATPLVKEASSGSHHKAVAREPRPRAEPTRKSKRSRKAVDYADAMDSDSDKENSAAPARDQGGPSQAAALSAPQCKAHGARKHKNGAEVVAVVQQQQKMLGDRFLVLVEWPLKVDAGKNKERCTGKRRRDKAPKPNAGKYAKGFKHHVDIVLAKQTGDGEVTAVVGWEVHGPDHWRTGEAEEDERKSELAGFHIEPVGDAWDAFDISAAVAAAMHEVEKILHV